MQVAENLRRSQWVLAALMLCAGAENSARGQFTTVINSPPEPVPYTLAPGTQVNINAGAMTGAQVRTGNGPSQGEGSEINLLGGEHETSLVAQHGGVVNVFDGLLRGEVYASNAGVINVFGGTFKRNVQLSDGGAMNVFGGHLDWGVRLDGGATLRVHAGGISGTVLVNSESSVALEGGFVARTRNAGSLTHSGGRVDRITAEDGATSTLIGGSVYDLWARQGSTIELVGGEFRFDSDLIEGTSTVGDSVLWSPSHTGTISGVLADGTPFAFPVYGSDAGDVAPFTLTRAELPDIGPSDLRASTDPVPLGIRQGQSIVVDSGGTIPEFFTVGVGASVLLEPGGLIDGDLKVAGGEARIEGGVVGEVRGLDGSNVSISGGVVRQAVAYAGSSFDISGGALTHAVSNGGELSFFGSDFRIDGAPIEGLGEVGSEGRLELTPDSVLSAILADGTPIAMVVSPAYYPGSHSEGGYFAKVTDPPEVGPAVIHVSTDESPLGAREGQTIFVGEGGRLVDGFTAVDGSRVVIEEGGAAGAQLNILGSELEINGGRTGHLLIAESTVRMTGGEVRGADLRSGAVFHLSNGLVSAPFHLKSGAELQMTGGIASGVTSYGAISKIEGGRVSWLRLRSGSKVAISGGSVTLEDVRSHTTIEVSGGELFLSPYNLLATNVRLSGGEIKTPLLLESDSSFIMTGGTLGSLGKASWKDSDVSIRGGAIRSQVLADGSDVHISGGVFENHLLFDSGSEVQVEGGQFQSPFRLEGHSSMNITGYHFAVDGVALDSLPYGQSIALEMGDSVLGAVLLDGTEVLLEFSTSAGNFTNYVAPDSLLTLTLVEFPGDFNHDGYVDAADYTVWRDGLGDAYSQYDFLVWKKNFGASIYDGLSATLQAAPVPEPSALALVLLAALAGVRRSIRCFFRR